MNERLRHSPQIPSDNPCLDQPLPRYKRRRKKFKADRGLPPDEELVRLVKAYLDRQRKLWPDLADRGFFPEPSTEVVQAMVHDLKERHRGEVVDPAAIQSWIALNLPLGGSYSRYSCENSTPTSIIDQLSNQLDRAKRDEFLIPFFYVYCDYSVSGLDSSRRGYTAYKAILTDAQQPIKRTYVDEFTRPSRDEVEWWKLAYLSWSNKKGLIGCTDGFDISQENADVIITMYGLVSRIHIKGLRGRVRRGMQGAAERGTSLGKLPLGFTRIICRDEHGIAQFGGDGLPIYVRCHDPGTAEHVILLFRAFVEKRWTAGRIAKLFNRLKVDGWDGWTEGSIKLLLRNEAYIGVFIWNRTSHRLNYDTERWEVVPNPRKEWRVFYNKELALIPMEWWRAAQRRLSDARRACPHTGKPRTRNQKSASTLFSGTLFCRDCQAELKLVRSAGKYKQFGCLNGPAHGHQCRLRTSKSLKVVEQSLLSYLSSTLLSEATINALVPVANAFLAEESLRPRTDTRPKKAEVRKLQVKIRRLVKKVEDEESEQLCDGYHSRIKELQKAVNLLTAEIAEEERKQTPVPAPLDAEAIKGYLPGLREILGQEIPATAEAICALTGPIKIHQEKMAGRKRGAKWIATFTPGFMRFLAKVAREKNYPESITLEYLRQGEKITLTIFSVVVCVV